jgi:hypothetical protein
MDGGAVTHRGMLAANEVQRQDKDEPIQNAPCTWVKCFHKRIISILLEAGHLRSRAGEKDIASMNTGKKTHTRILVKIVL